MSDDKLLEVLTDIRNWTRAASFSSVKALLQQALPDEKSRSAYQMLDGASTLEQVRVECKMSPNAVIALAQRCASMGLMEIREDKKRIRLFDLKDFGLMNDIDKAAGGPKP
jgi:hypothetical protein